MKKYETFIGALFGLGLGGLAFLAIFVVVVVIYKGPVANKIPAPTAVAAAETPEPTQAEPADQTAPTGTDVVAEAEPVAAPTAGIDLAAGEKAFNACKACHKAEKGAKHATGPALWGMFDGPIAAQDWFKYSDALLAHAGQTWDAATLDTYLTKPAAFAPGTKMSYAGMKKADDRRNLTGWLALQSDTPVTLAEAAPVVPDAADVADTTVTSAGDAGPYADLADDAIITLDPIPFPEGVIYQNPPEPTSETIADIAAELAALETEIPALDYQRALYHPIHFPPAIETASNEECLACHQEILANDVLAASPAGVTSAETMAWYQTLDTYAQGQSDFHWRHMQSDFAQSVMNLQCNFCHKGNDPREESPDMMPSRDAFLASSTPEFTLRKMVNPSETCLLCHGAMPDPENIMGLGGPWHEVRADLEYAETPNGCLSCHAETFRTNRHNVTYLKAANIEDLARAGTSDTCYGCHGGRAWYRISYPYARTPWPLMDTETVPDWALDRPTQSKPEYHLTPAP